MKITALLISTAIVLGSLALTGCGKEEPAPEPEAQAPPMVLPEPPAPPKENVKPVKGFTATKSGLQYKDIVAGKGAEAVEGARVKVHYKGWLDDGKVFDESRQHGTEPFAFTIGAGQVIKGWDEGVAGMKVGGTRELIIPPSIGYGDQDMGKIPPNSTLHFKVELVGIETGG